MATLVCLLLATVATRSTKKLGIFACTFDCLTPTLPASITLTVICGCKKATNSMRADRFSITLFQCSNALGYIAPREIGVLALL